MNRRVFLAFATVFLPVALGGCASGGGGSSIDRDLLTEEELAPYLAQDVYQAVRRLRSTWLSARSSMGSPELTDDPTVRGGPGRRCG